MMCRVCGCCFSGSEVKKGYDEYPYGEGYIPVCTHAFCPECGADEWCEEDCCVQCGEEMPESELANGFCRFCLEELEQTADWIRSMLSPAQKRWFAEHPEWIEK